MRYHILDDFVPWFCVCVRTRYQFHHLLTSLGIFSFFLWCCFYGTHRIINAGLKKTNDGNEKRHKKPTSQSVDHKILAFLFFQKCPPTAPRRLNGSLIQPNGFRLRVAGTINTFSKAHPILSWKPTRRGHFYGARARACIGLSSNGIHAA